MMFRFKPFYIFLILCVSYTNIYADNWVRAYENNRKSSYSQTSLVLPSGDIIVGGTTFDDDGVIIKTDPNGRTIKEQRITKTKFIKKIIYTNDNQLFVCGMTDSVDTYNYNVFWMKLDLNLNVIWSFTSTRNFRDICESAIQHSDGTYYIVGYGSRTGNSLSDRDAMIYHIDVNGDLIDSKISSNFGADYFNNIVESPDGNLVVIGTKLYQVAMDMYIARFSKDMTLLQSKNYGGLEDESAYDVLLDNGFVYVLGGTHSAGAGGYDVVLTKYDLSLNRIAIKTYGSKIEEAAMSMCKINNELILIGNMDTVFVKDSTYVPTKVFFIKTDLDLNYISAYYFREQSRVNSINNSTTTSNNEIVVSFTSSFFSKNNVSDIVILKTDSFNLGCCNYIDSISFIEKTPPFIEKTLSFVFNTSKNSIALGAGTGEENFAIAGYCGKDHDTTQIKTANNSRFCKNEPILFKANTSIDPIQSTWIFGDTISIIDTAGNDVIFKFDSIGVFNIYYIAEFKCNSDTDTISIEIVSSKPYVVQLDKVGECLNKPIDFGVLSSSETIIAYRWNFNDPFSTEDTSSLSFPSYIYTRPGTYKVYLFSTTYCGSKLDSIDVVILDKSTVELDKTVKTYCKNTNVPFNLNLSEVPINTSWNFGDPSSPNNTTTGNTASHTYTKGGNYICTVISEFNCASDTDTIHLTILEFYPSPVQISYTGLCANQPFQFNVSDILTGPTYTWEIERNSSIINYNSKSFTHQFNSEGEYIIRVNVSDNNCNTGLDTLILQVAEFSTADINVINDPCLKDLVFNPINKSSNVLWKLSDGYESNENTLVYSFQNSGDYEVTLITNPNSNCSDTTTTTVSYIKENANGGVYIPSIFSPNGDGKNDEFIIVNTTNNPCKLISFKVYDRWGKIMHSVNKFEEFKWDGKFNGTAVMPGTYVGFLETETGTSSFVINVVY